MSDSLKECANDLIDAIQAGDVQMVMKCFAELRDELPSDPGKDDESKDSASDSDDDEADKSGDDKAPALLIGLAKKK